MIIRVAAAFRVIEMALMSGYFLIGYLASTEGRAADWPMLVVLTLSVFGYVMAVYALNTVADRRWDIYNARLAQVASVPLQFSIISGAAALTVSMLMGFMILNSNVLVPMVAFICWVIYYCPPLRLKARPVAGTLIHAVAAVLHFHYGWLADGPITCASVLMSMYFMLLLVIGHLNHERIDREPDLMAGANNTLRWAGERKVVLFIRLVAHLATGYIILLWYFGQASMLFAGCFLPASMLCSFLVHSDSMSRPMDVSNLLRLTFAIAGAIYALAVIFL